MKHEARATGFYIHIPFCVRKCPYCDFYSVEVGSDYPPHEKYLSEILKQLHQLAPASASGSPITVYFGGGTPSLMPTSFFERTIEEISKKVDLSNDVEITCEVNPGTVDDIQWFKDLFRTGVNRVSIGVQSFDDKMLKALGRIHTSEEAQIAIASAQDAGFENVSIDLMSGLPCQTMEMLIDDLKMAMAFQPRHISVYQLTLPSLSEGLSFPGLTGESRIKMDPRIKSEDDKKDRQFSIMNLPSDDILAKMYETTKRVLERGGWRQYEISNYSHIGYESQHNLNYWNYGEYIGLGPASSSFSLLESNIPVSSSDLIRGSSKKIDSRVPTTHMLRWARKHENDKENMLNDDRIFATRTTVKPDLQKYLAGNLEYEIDNITTQQAMGEFCFLGLRKIDGISLSDFEKVFETNLLSVFKSQISKFVSDGLLDLSDESLKLTSRGILLSNQVFREFV